MRVSTSAVLAGALAAVAVASPAAAQPAPASAPPTSAAALIGEYEVRANQVYLRASGLDLRLDAYVPRADTGPRPAAVFIHGGGWMSATKEAEALWILPYLERGFVGVNVEYRLASTAPAPAAVGDCRCALRWIVRNAARLRIDPKRIVVTGYSAGGHLALTTGMLPASAGFDDACATLEPDSWSSAPQPELPVAAIVSWSGITDVEDVRAGENARGWALEWFAGVVDAPAVARRVSPLTYVRAGLPPVLTVHGDKDTVVPYAHAVRLHQALDKAGVPNRLVTIPGGQHGGWSRAEREAAYAAIMEFLRERGLMP